MTAVISIKQAQKLRILAKDCSRCGSQFSTKWARQAYCEECRVSKMEDAARRSIEARQRSKSDAIKIIHEKSDAELVPMVGLFDRPEYLWVTYFSVPLSSSSSKNARFNFSRLASGPAVTKAVKDYQSMIAYETKKALSGRTIVNNKLWVSLFVFKSDNKSDAINVVDTVCDGIRDGAGIDDRWFSIDQVNWAIRKRNPQIVIRIGQETDSDVLVCSHCGDLRPYGDFTANSSTPSGRGRVCTECRSLLNLHSNRIRRQL